MRIAYFVHLNLGPKSGVYKKILNQLRIWIELGMEPRFFIVTRSKDVKEGVKHSELKDFITLVEYSTKSYSGLFNRIRAFCELEKKVLDFSPNIIYTRQDLFYPPVKKIAQMTQMVVEINTDDLYELWGYSKAQWFYSLVTRNIILNSVSGLVFVTRDLAKARHFKKFSDKPHKVIGNGICLSHFSVSQPNKDEKFFLVFLGQAGCPWHGVDKLKFIAEAYPDWQIDIIGSDKDNFGLSVPPNIHFHGILHKSAYEAVLSRADCAIGTLALHRNNMMEASPLKTREYLAYGLPVIIGYQDTDFPKGADFLLQLPNTEQNIEENRDLIERFIKRWKGRRVPRNDISHLDLKIKEKERLNFFSSLLK